MNAFWSITLYDAEGFQVGNSLNRFRGRQLDAVQEPTRMARSTSISRTRARGKDKETNWLPAPKGAFNLTMRLYGPKSEALTGKWSPPAVTKAQ